MMSKVVVPLFRHLQERFPLYVARRFLIGIAGILLFGTVAAIAVAPLAPESALLPEDRQIKVQDLALPALNEQLAQIAQRQSSYVREEAVRRGDTIGALLARLQIEDPEVMPLLSQDPTARNMMRQLKAGRALQAEVDQQGRLLWMRYSNAATTEDAQPASVSRVLSLRRKNGADSPLSVQEENLTNEVGTEIRTGTIRSSLYAATDAAGVPDAIANQMAEILSGDIDFHTDLRKGDAFRVVYENYYQNGEKIEAGRILALEFFANRKTHQAILFGNDYYSPDGKSLKKAFLRSPMAFTRVTSGFAMRFHPILKTWRAHKGVDYGAPSGTPIRAVADGVVEFAGVKGGYGNVVVIRHGGMRSTLYGHMSKFGSGIKRGSPVQQSQVIGYVGQTGWATGPHLHYEFLLNGEQHNPLTIALPAAQPLQPNQLSSFQQTFETVRKKLELVQPPQQTDRS
jgi:murein DD-endopeptidase MepM/ murein hydrolase activator NlpD